MNPDNPNFRTPEEQRRAEAYVAAMERVKELAAERDKYRAALEEIVEICDDGNPCREMPLFIASEALKGEGT